jgi:general secretion pathway protein C
MTLARHHRLATELVLLALVAYLAALGVSAGVRAALDDAPPPAPPFADTPHSDHGLAPLATYDLIAERDIFNPGGHSAAARPSRGGSLRLWGVALSGREAHAVIEDTATHRQDLYRVGDEVGGARVAAIDWDRVTLASAGGEETLVLATPESAPPSGDEPTAPAARSPDDRIRHVAENAFIVDRRELVGAVDNMSGLMTQLRAVAEVEDGRPAGFRLFQIRDDSLFARLGLRNGDVVQRVNGSPMSDPTALLAFLKRLHDEPRVALDIVRGGAPRTLVYELR